MNNDRELRAFYFPHDIGASNDPKLVNLRMRFGWKAIGMFWAIIEALHKEEEGKMPDFMISSMILDFYSQEEIRESRHIREEAKELEECLYANALLVVSDGITTSERVQENLVERKAKSETAKKNANERWHPTTTYKECKSNATAMPKQCKSNASKGKESKVNNTTIKDVFEYFLLKTKKAFRLTPTNRAMINQRLEQGYTVEQLKTAIDNFVLDDWEGRAKNMDLIYCLGKQNGKPDALEKWLNYQPKAQKEEVKYV